MICTGHHRFFDRVREAPTTIWRKVSSRYSASQVPAEDNSNSNRAAVFGACCYGKRHFQLLSGNRRKRPEARKGTVPGIDGAKGLMELCNYNSLI